MEKNTRRGSKKLYNTAAVDLFSLPPTDVSLVSGEYEKICPNTNFIGNSDPICFRMSKSNGGYLDLSDSFLHIGAKICRDDGSNLLETDTVAAGNLFLHTMFQDVNVKINETPVDQSNNVYPYIAWLQKQLILGQAVKDGELSKEMYYKDTEPDDYTSADTGYQKRMALSAGSKRFDMVGRLCLGVFEQNRYLLDFTTVEIELHRSIPRFCLSTTDGHEYQVEILEASFYCKRHLLAPTLTRSIKQKLNKGLEALYPFTRTFVATGTITMGSYTYRRLVV
jgi:hypothetical protein